ncbi:hypothetical protein PCANC_09325 [Puccinia coronata f. sp. avenae]|uniref:HAT C-terminal dimerisation domain-containing protein n=1 Tax=Puccinia coronata f. sp. avenae TaxID=200324 RepID=A0A2N5T5G8_9BASI|nr:hypothetical protein PCANC_09325 [Puccinia coronata f. sp. avenae]
MRTPLNDRDGQEHTPVDNPGRLVIKRSTPPLDDRTALAIERRRPPLDGRSVLVIKRIFLLLITRLSRSSRGVRAPPGNPDNSVVKRSTCPLGWYQLGEQLDTVIKQITRSAAQRADFDRVAKELKLKVSPLIAGYGIRWNIKYQSYTKAVKAQAVIDHILREDLLQQGAGVFNGAFFFPKDWQEIESLTSELKILVELTSEMEGNSATGTHVIPKYLQLAKGVKGKIVRAWETDSLYPMYHAMLSRTKKYLDKAMECKTLVIATILHPDRMEQAQKKKATSKAAVPDDDVIEIASPPGAQPTSLMDRLAAQTTHQPTPPENEIKTYLKANIPFKKGAINQKTTPLKWWKVNQRSYPTLAFMACTYLGAAGSSCAVESVSSLMWLREDVPLKGDFAEAGKALRASFPSKN